MEPPAQPELESPRAEERAEEVPVLGLPRVGGLPSVRASALVWPWVWISGAQAWSLPWELVELGWPWVRVLEQPLAWVFLPELQEQLLGSPLALWL